MINNKGKRAMLDMTPEEHENEAAILVGGDHVPLDLHVSMAAVHLQWATLKMLRAGRQGEAARS